MGFFHSLWTFLVKQERGTSPWMCWALGSVVAGGVGMNVHAQDATNAGQNAEEEAITQQSSSKNTPPGGKVEEHTEEFAAPEETQPSAELNVPPGGEGEEHTEGFAAPEETQPPAELNVPPGGDEESHTGGEFTSPPKEGAESQSPDGLNVPPGGSARSFDKVAHFNAPTKTMDWAVNLNEVERLRVQDTNIFGFANQRFLIGPCGPLRSASDWVDDKMAFYWHADGVSPQQKLKAIQSDLSREKNPAVYLSFGRETPIPLTKKSYSAEEIKGAYHSYIKEVARDLGAVKGIEIWINDVFYGSAGTADGSDKSEKGGYKDAETLAERFENLARGMDQVNLLLRNGSDSRDPAVIYAISGSPEGIAKESAAWHLLRAAHLQNSNFQVKVILTQYTRAQIEAYAGREVEFFQKSIEAMVKQLREEFSVSADRISLVLRAGVNGDVHGRSLYVMSLVDIERILRKAVALNVQGYEILSSAKLEDLSLQDKELSKRVQSVLEGHRQTIDQRLKTLSTPEEYLHKVKEVVTSSSAD